MKDYTLNLVPVQEISAGGQGRDNQAFKGVRITGLLDLSDLCVKVRHVASTPLNEVLPCPVNVAIEPDQLHVLSL